MAKFIIYRIITVHPFVVSHLLLLYDFRVNK